jgi:hypothetical protein
MEKINETEHSKQNQPSPGVLKETSTVSYGTCREDITEIEIASIQPCPIIPDYKEPTTSTLPMVVKTPTASFCIDGWNFIEQSKAIGWSTIRCHISHIAQHSDTELAIRKVAIRVLPQGGKCSYAELVRNTQRLYRNLQDTSDDLVLFSHGGDRRGAGFTSSRENNIRAVLAHRLGKSPTTINKYLQHGDNLNDAANEALVDAGTPKLFFEAFQVKKQLEVATLKADQKDEIAIESDISNQVSTWLNEFQQPVPSKATPPESPQSSQEGVSPGIIQPTPSENLRPTSKRRIPQDDTGINEAAASDLAPTNQEGVAGELKRIGEALIEIANDQQRPTPQQVELIIKLILKLSTLLKHLVHNGLREGNAKGGTV